MTFVFNRALPFVITLIIGTGLGNIFGIHEPARPRFDAHRARCSKQSNIEAVDVPPLSDFSTKLEILDQPNTRYTRDALENNVGGVVALLVRFNADGTTTVVKRLKTLPYGLTEDAERVADHTLFAPATVHGSPVSETREMNYIYTPLVSQIRQH